MNPNVSRIEIAFIRGATRSTVVRKLSLQCQLEIILIRERARQAIHLLNGHDNVMDLTHAGFHPCNVSRDGAARKKEAPDEFYHMPERLKSFRLSRATRLRVRCASRGQPHWKAIGQKKRACLTTLIGAVAHG